MRSPSLVGSTHIQLTDSVGQSMVRTSCGTEGFKNIKKSTPVAAQTAGISAAAVSVCCHSPATAIRCTETLAHVLACQENQYVKMIESCLKAIKWPEFSLETLVCRDPSVEECWTRWFGRWKRSCFEPTNWSFSLRLSSQRPSSLCLPKEKCCWK